METFNIFIDVAIEHFIKLKALMRPGNKKDCQHELTPKSWTV
jgi:hypothetical protein